ncbi:hypothetical protein EfmJHP38_05180 [Enterococcus faecium]|nr:hypothetical protein EfmJHP38_05180 [Enterococcus faecium]
MIEDSYNGIKAGKRANMKVLAIKDKRFSQDVSLADDVIYEKQLTAPFFDMTENKQFCKFII